MPNDDEALLSEFAQAGGNPSDLALRQAVVALGRHASALYPLVRRDPSLLEDVLKRPLARPTDAGGFQALMASAAAQDEPSALRRELRQARHRAVLRIALREVLGLADIDQTSAEMAWLADAAVAAAVTACTRAERRRSGTPVDERGAEVTLTCLGMGKQGGEELNLGSDVDLCFFYGTDAAQLRQSDGTLSDEPSVHEHFARIVRNASQALADVTEDGFVFRVDLRLRPEGSRGPLVNSIASAERYYETWGRTWERAALLRARPVAGDLQLGAELLRVLQPFIYRRAVEPELAAEMTTLVERARRELSDDPDADVKLGRGGIREAEFFVQSLQLVWGGRYPELQVSGTVEATRRLMAAGLISDREGRELEADWALLRRVEHRIHVQAGYQTHRLPAPGPRRQAFARSLGFDDADTLDETLEHTRARVHRLFCSLTSPGDETQPELDDLCELVSSGADAESLIDRIAVSLPMSDRDAAAAHLTRLGRRPRSPLGPLARKELPTLGPLLLAEVGEAADPDLALLHLAGFFGRLGGSWGYDRLLVEQPLLRRRLIGLFGASATLSAALIARAETLDDVLTSGGPTNQSRIERLHQPFASFGAEVTADLEGFTAALRRARTQGMLEVGLATVGGDSSERQTAQLLTALADEQIAAALRFATAAMQRRYGTARTEAGESAELAVVGLGKLGAAELGFGSDLDLVFIYDEDGETDGERQVDNVEAFARTAQLVLRLLSQTDPEGPGYVTDARLRPSGSQGMLVASLAGFDRYHRERAQSWERQAMLRARVVCSGTETFCSTLEERFAHVAYEGNGPDLEKLAELRHRMEIELAGEGPGRYHPKLGFGGLVDVEFVVQSLQMRHGADRHVRTRHTLDAIEALETRGHLLPADAEALREGYVFLRRIEQVLRLQDEGAEPMLHEGGRAVERVARRLSLRDRDGATAPQVLIATLRRHCEEVRSVFERHVAPVGSTAPWARSSEDHNPERES